MLIRQSRVTAKTEYEAVDMYSVGGDYIGCTVKDSCDGYYKNCNQMLDSDCILNNVLEGDNNDS